MRYHAAYFILCSILSLLVEAHDFNEIAASKAWRSLLYANENSFFSIQSRADSKKFFFTDNGKTNLVAELEASVQAVQNEDQQIKKIPLTDQSFSCRFPARAAFIRKNILMSQQIDESGCLKLLAWRDKISAESVTLVFSSYYLGNPSSTFGHTLLRINNSGKNKTVRRELLSYGINYGANPWTQNPLLYSVYGLFGLFPGNFIPIPYYYKVREYNDFESRDLWEYDLELTSEEVYRLVDLLWEQGENFYDYYFLSENCGYYIVALVEAAAPRYEIVSELRKWVIPSDTIVQFQKSGIIKSRKWRPSIYNQFQSRLQMLSSDQKDIVYEVFKMVEKHQFEWPDAYLKLNNQEKSQVLDATLDYYDFIHNKELAHEKSPENLTKNQLLVQRSLLPTALKLSEKNLDFYAPENAHGSFRWQLTAQSDEAKNIQMNNQNSLIIGGRFAFHDLEDPLQGYPDGAHIEVMNLKLKSNYEKNTSDQIKVQELKIFEVGSYADWNRWTRKKSYDVSAGFFRLDNNFCDSCMTTQLNFAYGLTKLISNFRISLLGQTHYMYADFISGEHNGNNYFSFGPRIVIQYDYDSDFQMRIESEHQSISTANKKIWTAETALRKNFLNKYAIEIGAKTNEVNNTYNASFYYFTF